MPVTVDWLICSYDVQVLTLRLVQPPLDVRVMPEAASCEAACASVSLVTAWAGDAGPSRRPVSAAAVTASRVKRWRSECCMRVVPCSGGEADLGNPERG